MLRSALQSRAEIRYAKSRPGETQRWSERKADADLFQKWQEFSAQDGRAMHKNFVLSLEVSINPKECGRRLKAFREWLKSLVQEHRIKADTESDAGFAKRRAKGMTTNDLRRLLKMATTARF